MERRCAPTQTRRRSSCSTRAGAGGGLRRLRAALDAAVRACASLAVALAKAGGCGVMLPGDRRPTTLDASLGGWTHLHARMASSSPGAIRSWP
jgi:uncharacterized protein (DUF58 family)